MNDAYADIARAYDLLSGEIHASTKTALIQDSRFVRYAAMTRLRNQAYPATSLQSSVWTQTLGSWNDTQSDGNAAGMTHRTHGLLVGGDKALGDWHIGALGGYSYSNIDSHARQSNSRSNSLHLGVYAGRQWQRWALRTGAAYSHHDIKTRRSAEVNGYTDRLSANYQAGVLQTYAELGYRLQAGHVLLEPFGNLAYTHLRTDGFHEQGEAAALQSHNQSDDNVFSVLGLRTSVPLTVGKASAQFHATLGWQHAYGTVRPTATHAFKGGDPFTVQAAPLARDGALLTAGLDVELTDTSRLGVGYQGQFGSGLEQHGVKVDFRWRF